MRVRALDAIRGLAAFAVLLHHCILSAPLEVNRAIGRVVAHTPLQIIYSARSAVILFFALSGFVLTLSLRPARAGLRGYVLKRTARIYLPFAVSILFSALLCLAFGGAVVPDTAGWLNEIWSMSPTPTLVLGHLSMLGRPQDLSLNPVVWSLWYELRISLILPLLVLFATAVGTRWMIAATVLLAVAVELAMRRLGIWSNPVGASDGIGAALVTLHFLPLFVGGMLLALHAPAVVALVARLPVVVTAGLWIVAILALMRFSDAITMLGAFLVIALAIGSPRTSDRLANPVLLWLGRVSFSLYLVHVPVIAVLFRIAGPQVPWIAKTLLVIVASAILAELGYRFVERPAQQIGRWLSDRFDPRNDPVAVSSQTRPVPD